MLGVCLQFEYIYSPQYLFHKPFLFTRHLGQFRASVVVAQPIPVRQTLSSMTVMPHRFTMIKIPVSSYLGITPYSSLPSYNTINRRFIPSTNQSLTTNALNRVRGDLEYTPGYDLLLADTTCEEAIYNAITDIAYGSDR